MSYWAIQPYTTSWRLDLRFICHLFCFGFCFVFFAYKISFIRSRVFLRSIEVELEWMSRSMPVYGFEGKKIQKLLLSFIYCPVRIAHSSLPIQCSPFELNTEWIMNRMTIGHEQRTNTVRIEWTCVKIIEWIFSIYYYFDTFFFFFPSHQQLNFDSLSV